VTSHSDYKNADVRPRASLSDYIWVKENSLTRYFCNKVIKKFDEDPRKIDGRVGQNKRVDKNIKVTKDFSFSGNKDWEKEDAIFYTALKEGLKEYLTHLISIHKNNKPATVSNQFRDTGYKLQRYEPGGFYDWHNDWTMDNKNGSRVYVFMWYLNTIRKKDGGYTEFTDGTRLQPKCGSLVFFPATWTYLHRGYPPKVRKYLCNGWIFAKP
jgi:hypothetical protein